MNAYRLDATVVVPNYNGRRILEACLRSLTEQSHRPAEIILVDNGSHDDSVVFVRTHFPDVRSYRIGLHDLEQDATRERLRQMWTEPYALDPSRRSAKVTREVAAQLAELAKSLEASGHSAETVANFLMRCIFTMFAEDVGLECVTHSGVSRIDAAEVPEALRKPRSTFYKFFSPNFQLAVAAAGLEPRVSALDDLADALRRHHVADLQRRRVRPSLAHATALVRIDGRPQHAHEHLAGPR